ncbi:hypothetical protein ABXT72_04600 [Candidatus Pelagibacter sp. Uisw_094]|uniref:hypothetical protein n=1 Tax=Candidatus Pelagibacter sp. Uisw_094 TaxID=3230980 RepID=UPI0039E9C71D
MAGLLGVGGGLITVPFLYYALTVLEFELATSNALSSWNVFCNNNPNVNNFDQSYEFNAVDFNMVKCYGIFMLLGVYSGDIICCKSKDTNSSTILLNICFYGGFIILFS